MNKEYPIVTLCGSSRQKKDWEKYQRLLALKGYCVLNINIYLGLEDQHYNEETEIKELLRQLHRQKIRMANVIAIIPKADGSIGDHTQEEKNYALSLGKKVIMVKDLLLGATEK